MSLHLLHDLMEDHFDRNAKFLDLSGKDEKGIDTKKIFWSDEAVFKPNDPANRLGVVY